VAVGDFAEPAGQGASRGADLDGVVLVLEVAGWFSHDGLGGGYVGEVACRPDYFFGVARGEQAGQLRVAFVVEAFMRLAQQSSHPVQRVALAAPVAEGVILRSPAALAELAAGDLDHMERLRYLGGVAERVVERVAVRAGQV